MIQDLYQRKLEEGILEPDAAQARAVEAMQRLETELARYTESTRPGLFNAVKRALLGKPAAPRGLYLWGGVGRGKTLLMNMLRDSLPGERTERMHFHHFMLDVHARLAGLQRDNGRHRNPLRTIARHYAESYRVLFLDEFIVTNITDAMLLYGLLDAMFDQGVVLVMTTNRVPEDLYLNGLQRERFVPAIALIRDCTVVVHLDSDIDHRSELSSSQALYYWPVDEQVEAAMRLRFESLASSEPAYHSHISVNRRAIPFIARAANVIWFDFDVLCHAPRATPDYIEIAAQYGTLVLSGVPVLTEDTDDKARRFIYLIDELYDRRVTLVISADAPAEELYRGEMLAFAFRRTASRLLEMRSDSYLEESRNRSR